MFRSATLKLTAWYVGILMLISVSFSLVIFQISSTEITNRLSQFQKVIENILPNPFDETMLGTNGAESGTIALAVRLVYLNIGVLVVGTAASYLLARRTLKPVEEAHEAEIRFVSDASHELRTPLAIMKSEIEMTLRDPSSTKAELREILQSNLEEVNNLNAMSETLLKMSKIESDVPMRTTKISPVVLEAAQRFKQPESRLSVKLIGNPKVYANPELLQEAIVIIIDNALKYSPNTSTVQVSTKTRGSDVHIVVENVGNGISADDLDHIFDRFYRSDPSRTGYQSQKGFGLGLSLAKQIIELHNGYITASSAINDVTIFTIVLRKSAR